jgi:hypothetical protein
MRRVRARDERVSHAARERPSAIFAQPSALRERAPSFAHEDETRSQRGRRRAGLMNLIPRIDCMKHGTLSRR